MKRLLKILVCAGLVTAGMLGFQQKARAQFIVSDPTNLVQSILQYIQDQIREGNFDITQGISKLEGMREEFQMNKDKLAQVQAIVAKYQAFKQTYQEISMIVEITKLVTDDILALKETQFLMSEVSSYQAVATVGNLIKSYGRMTDSLTKEIGDEMFDLSKITQANPMEMVSQLHELTEYLYSGYLIIRRTYMSAVQKAYYEDQRNKSRERDYDFFQTLFY